MRKFDLTAAILAVIAFVILLYQINKPFWGQFDWTGSWFGTIAGNYLQIDISKTLLAPITTAGTQDRTLWTYYNHYPVTYPLIVAGSIGIFGNTEWSVRIVSVVFTVLMIMAFYILCRKFFHPLVGIFGIICILVTPMFIYYGKLPVHEQPVLFLSLMAVSFYVSKNYKLMTLFTVLAFLVSWTGAYILILISIHKRRLFVPACLILVIIALLHLLHIYISSDIKDFFGALTERTTSGGSPVTFVIKQVQWFLALYTKPLALISLCGLIFWRRPLLLMFFAWGFFQWFVVNRIMWIHDYMLIYFLPFVALSCGLFFFKIWEKNKIFCVVILLTTLCFSLFLSLPFTKALLNSKDQTAKLYYLAKFVKEHTVYGDKVTVNLPLGSDFEIHYPIHYLSYYSNRYFKYEFSSSDQEVIRVEKL